MPNGSKAFSTFGDGFDVSNDWFFSVPSTSTSRFRDRHLSIIGGIDMSSPLEKAALLQGHHPHPVVFQLRKPRTIFESAPTTRIVLH